MHACAVNANQLEAVVEDRGARRPGAGRGQHGELELGGAGDCLAHAAHLANGSRLACCNERVDRRVGKHEPRAALELDGVPPGDGVLDSAQSIVECPNVAASRDRAAAEHTITQTVGRRRFRRAEEEFVRKQAHAVAGRRSTVGTRGISLDYKLHGGMSRGLIGRKNVRRCHDREHTAAVDEKPSALLADFPTVAGILWRQEDRNKRWPKSGLEVPVRFAKEVAVTCHRFFTCAGQIFRSARGPRSRGGQ